MPDVEVYEDTVSVALEGCHFLFADILVRPQKFDAELTVTRPIPTDPLEALAWSPGDPAFSAHISSKSLSNVEAYRRALQNYYGKDILWERLLHQACRKAEAAYRNAVIEVDPDDVDISGGYPDDIEAILPENELSCIFGLAEAAKSLSSLALALGMAEGGYFLDFPARKKRTLWLDYENPTPAKFAMRRNRLILGGVNPEAGAVKWMSGRGVPVAELLPAVRAAMEREAAEVLMLDSVGFACGGDALNQEVATRTANALLSLKKTVLMIAQTTKAEDDKYPFGSHFWHYAIHGRSWYVKVVRGGEWSEDLTLGWYNRKSSDGPRPKDFACEIKFDGTTGPITFDKANIMDFNRLTGRQTASQKITDVLKNGKLAAKEIADRSGLTFEVVRARLKDMKDNGKVVKLETAEWALAYE